MSVSVIVGFVACWLPYFVVSLVRIFTDYRVRLSGLLSAAELLALAHSALNPLIYGLFSARTLRRSCGQRCQRRRSLVLPSSSTCCCCCGHVVADLSPDVAHGAAPPPSPLVLSQPPPMALRDMAHVGRNSGRRRGRSVDVRPTSTDTSTTDTAVGPAADDGRCRKSASAEFQRAMTSALVMASATATATATASVMSTVTVMATATATATTGTRRSSRRRPAHLHRASDHRHAPLGRLSLPPSVKQ